MNPSTQAAGIPRLSTLDLFPALDLADREVSLERLLASAPLPLEQALHLGAALAQRVAAIHASGRTVGLLDAQRVRISVSGQVSLTRAGVGALAPELEGGGSGTVASDIFAVGFMIHRLVTGQTPALDVAPSQLNPRLDAEHDPVLLAALRRAPDERPAAVLALQAALEGLAEELGLSADARGLGQRVERLLDAAPAVRQTLPPLPAADAWFANPDPIPMEPEHVEPTERGPNPRVLLGSSALALAALLFTGFALLRPVAQPAPRALPAPTLAARAVPPQAPAAKLVAQAVSPQPVVEPAPRAVKRPSKQAKVRRPR